jgi:hypothetical protein
MFLQSGLTKYFVFIVGVVLWLGFSISAPAQVTLLLEEPYSYDGTFAGTGHAAVYLTRVCAETPTRLRRCNPGENGVVISRYHHVDGHDWIAVPLIPYLYAVEEPGNIPLYADTKLVALLRHEYLQKIDIGGNEAYQLAGSAYDRTTYGFRVETTPEQDDALIRWMNSEVNRESYELIRRNCADFVKQIINFYYPHAIHRSVIADLGTMTPKQAGKTLVHSAKHHREMQLTTFIIPQVPGLKRSKPVHGVIESVVLAKKYVTPVLAFHPFLVGGVEAAYWAGWRFDPAKGALIFDPAGGLDKPLTEAQRRWYEKALTAIQHENIQGGTLADWRKLEARMQPQLGLAGQPILEVHEQDKTTQIGICRDNVLGTIAEPELVQDLLFARLHQELRPSKPAHASERQVETDWRLLQQATKAREASLAAGFAAGSD